MTFETFLICIVILLVISIVAVDTVHRLNYQKLQKRLELAQRRIKLQEYRDMEDKPSPPSNRKGNIHGPL